MFNMDFALSVLMDTNKMDWIASPMAGVYRKPLAREDAERGHATSLVRYEAGSVFRPHPHPLGEEILVLEGVFSDEKGDFCAGSYFRNPPGTSHAPYSKNGCLLLVKLHQFQATDLNQVCIHSSDIWFSQSSAVCPLYEYGEERVWLIRIEKGKDILASLQLSEAVELFVISGGAVYQDRSILAGTWLRVGDFDLNDLHIQSACFLWLKSGHF
ncbi:cupin domain-containing protein [Marinomonas transparens]|uniref:Cupin domain-containing protein n=1 Tax=Marinomonas transparens TaxID=2795388 RepID=A0A934N6Q2_9GAMM|nr:cupin domain-containing protein [Marinomonas transparens]MBJ7538271.1 cupin domain-containing protein [Marinomonas transparens]